MIFYLFYVIYTEHFKNMQELIIYILILWKSENILFPLFRSDLKIDSSVVSADGVFSSVVDI